MPQNRSSSKQDRLLLSRTPRIILDSAFIGALLLCTPFPFTAEAERDVVRSTTSSPIKQDIAAPPKTSCAPSWAVVESPNANDETNALNVVTGHDENDLWAVGHYDLFGT